ncbi:hypothetical protein MFLO_13495 [Listeria floridensis FSL S10-1187]|uniref:Uncharacterized protein n=1 Tax=Listeria floridensis FSL S10-1187 TaxID=1265817 RepID=A0ABP3AXF9_9LIST|nr:DUF3188 domain-containing protein [Listeria floridensis]EUJ27185.1 hypothetical protein MFLO_13495 [Listeria floridensis FSL S10-1187]
MKIANSLFIVCIGLMVIMFSPSFGKDGAASTPMMVTGLIIVAIGVLLVVTGIKKNKGQGGDKK